MGKQKFHFVVGFHYDLSIDEKGISSDEVEWESEQEKNEHHLFLHRLLNAIRGNGRLYYEVCEYAVLGKHDSFTSCSLFPDAYYDEKKMSLPKILLRYSDIFTEDDKEQLLSMQECLDKGEYDCYDLDDLLKCFPVDYAGYHFSHIPHKGEKE